MDRTSSTFDHPNLAVERAQSTFNEADMTDFLNGSHAETVVQKAIMLELEELKAKEASGVPIELDGGAASLDSAGIMPNQDHTLEEARLQTMKMLASVRPAFQCRGLLRRMRRARKELMSLFDPAWFTQWRALRSLGRRNHGAGRRGAGRRMVPEDCIHGHLLHRDRSWLPSAAEQQRRTTGDTDVRHPHTAAGGDQVVDRRCQDRDALRRVRPAGDADGWPGAHLRAAAAVTGRSLRAPRHPRGRLRRQVRRNGLDNGFLQFDHVRVPRERCLQVASVSEDGARTSSGRKQLQYGALIGGRAIMVTDSAIC